ncbi:type I DNA topoisomerase [Magnetovibrio sp. PR-2]|uniref:type I DNA topoisomerase n=1 Tax=Magnetovibrio sp. PR-2 TaxID=3120356 RepID=UPI002FCE0587
MHVVVVESPAKAKTINKYLGNDYKVLASYGHIRDLPSKDGSVRPDEDFAMDWEIDGRSAKQVKEIADAMKGADGLYLATDPDREGEAIAWHVREVLEKKKLLKDKDVKRVVFNEITKAAIQEAFNQPRELDDELVDAYMARRALDYLVGFTLSPVLWRKLPGSRSAGRVQSVALRIICERETEIEAFRPQEYWSVAGQFDTGSGVMVSANLTHLNGEKLDKMSLGSEDAAMKAKAAIESGPFSVAKIEKKKTRRNPPPPFMTSTLQQDASRKLHFSAKKTMQVAQRLYEGVNIGGETVGLITYMRTDGVTLAGEAVAAARSLIGKNYGEAYVPAQPRVFKSKAKNAQEAHEAIRPTDVFRHPKQMAGHLDADQLKLYELIWKRTVACQMEPVVLDQVAVDIAQAERTVVMRATGSMIAFDGFYRVYQEASDKSSDSEDRILPDMTEGQALGLKEVLPEQHFTQPPPRFSEASLVKKLEELGIGRPSTYASIISVLQDRNYVTLDKRRFIPEDRGRVVTTFLTSYFERYVEYGFTADLEEQLDDISGGRIDWKTVLKDFWSNFSAAVDGIKELRVREVLDTLDEVLAPHFFPEPEKEGDTDPRKCPTCGDGRLSLKLGKFGAFIGCSNYPECRFTRPLVTPEAGENADPFQAELEKGPKVLGTDPETGLEITVRKGPYGVYVQRGEIDPEDKKFKPKRSSIPMGENAAEVGFERALGLLSLPRKIGLHPENQEMIQAGIGRFGPYLQWSGLYVSLKEDDPVEVGLNRAVALIADSGKTPPVQLGKHPDDKKPILMKIGRWGPFVSHGRDKANLPKDLDKDDVTLEKALELLAAKSKGGAKKKAASKKKAAPKKKAATKKKAASKKKAATKKKAAAKKKTAS